MIQSNKEHRKGRIKMAKCKRCGKKGLLLKVDDNGLCAECAAIVSQQLDSVITDFEAIAAKQDEWLNHQDALLKDVLKAREEYKEDGDIEKAIAALEAAIIEAEPPLFSSHTSFLVDLYKKSGQNDKAWSLLNSCILDFARCDRHERMAMWQIRFEMAKLLKEEKKYSDAIGMYMLKYVYDIARGTEASATYDEERFLKNIKPCVSKLKWNDDIVSDLVAIVHGNIKRGENPAEAEKNVAEQYRHYLEEHHLNL